MAQLIARDAARSEYDPDIEAAAAAAATPIAIHPVTGASQFTRSQAPSQTPPMSGPLQRISSACVLERTLP